MRRFSFNSNPTQETEGILLNFDQGQPYTNNNLIGLIQEQNPLRGNEIEYKMHPGDAKKAERSKEIDPLRVKEYNVIEYPAGMISPQPITVVLPEMHQGLPKPVKSQKTEFPDPQGRHKNLGVILSQIYYQNIQIMKVLHEAAKQQPEMLKQMKQVSLQSRLDEAETEKVVKTIDEVLGAVDRNTSSSSNNS